MFMIRKQKEVPVYGEYDVIVAGGGVAGVAAALAAAQKGEKTLLIETQYMLGGLATAGLITYLSSALRWYGASTLLRLSGKVFKIVDF